MAGAWTGLKVVLAGVVSFSLLALVVLSVLAWAGAMIVKERLEMDGEDTE